MNFYGVPAGEKLIFHTNSTHSLLRIQSCWSDTAYEDENRVQSQLKDNFRDQPCEEEIMTCFKFSFTAVLFFSTCVMFFLYLEMRKNNTQDSTVPMQYSHHDSAVKCPQRPQSVYVQINMSYII